MAIADINRCVHLTAADIEELGGELDAIRTDIEEPRGERDATSDDAPETHSELKFRIREGVGESFGVDPDTGRRRGLRTALREFQTGDVAAA